MKFCAATCFLLLCISTGCDTVSLTHPIGEPASSAELKKLQGTWIDQDRGTLEVRISKSGELILGGLDWDNKTGKFKAINFKLLATRAGKLRFMCMTSADEPNEDKSSEDGYPFFMYEHADENTIHLYFPNTSRFQQAVESGELDGDIKKARKSISVHLTATSEELEAFMEKVDAKKYFEKEKEKTGIYTKRRAKTD